jgi:hypothetical protein
MSTDEYTTVRIRKDVLEKIDAVREALSASAPIPSKTSRSDVIVAAIGALEREREKKAKGGK